MPAVSPRIVRRVLVTLLLIAVLRLGQYVPLPYVDGSALAADPGPAYAFLDLVSGGGFGRLSVFALGIYPYFFAGSVMSVIVGASPRLKALVAEGSAGTRRLLLHRRILAVGIGAALGAAMAAAGAAGYFGDGAVATGASPMILMIACPAAATAVVMLIAEGIRRFGYGPAARTLALVPLLAGLADGFTRLAPIALAALLVASLVAVVGRVVVSQAHRRIPIGYARRMIGRRPAATPTYLPLHLVGGGDKALLVATVVMLLPTVAGDVMGLGGLASWDARDPWYLVVFALFVAIVTFTSTMTGHNLPAYVDRLQRTGGFVPGIRPGRPTGEFLGYVLVRLAAGGALLWTVAVLLPLGVGAALGAGPPFLALLPLGIFHTVETALGTGRQIQTEAAARRYAGHLR